MLTVSEQQQFLKRNSTLQSYPSDLFVPQLVAQHAVAAPEAVAVAAGSRVLTYRELDTRTNQLAHHLRSLGVGPEIVVGLCVDRCASLIVGALGILKAGGAYLPLDPAYPRDRLAFVLDDARAPVCVTEQRIAERLPAGKRRVVALDRDGAEIACQSQKSPAIDVRTDHLAYVVYTSGSTGRPKGVEISHGSLLNLVFWHRRAFGVTPADRAGQTAGLGFDAVVWELWPYLTAGASVHLPDEATRVSPELLRDWFVAQGITISFVPTALAERLLSLEWPPKTALRVLLTGGDTLHRYPSANLPFVLVNNYGPTECTVVATSGPVPVSERTDILPNIGRPTANTQIYILDEHLHQVGVGVTGELYVGGAGLARGYRNRPELTAARFIPDPFSKAAGARLYKTGDLARYLPDGQIAFVGRADEQIKMRSYRIEPNEIVTVVKQHPMVQTGWVMARESASGEKRLVAYIVPDPEWRLTRTAFQEFLQTHLPDYMVPSVFVLLDALPLTSNGKVDAASLPEPSKENTLGDEGFVAPRTPVEERLAGIMAELLGVEGIGVDDNFFLLGGHSLLGTQVITRVREAFGVDLALRTLFDSPTVSGLSVEIERQIVARLEGMSEEEAQVILGASGPCHTEPERN